MGHFMSHTKKTKGALRTSAVCAICNIVLNYVLLMKFGVVGVAVATMASFILLHIYRVKDTARLVRIPSEWKTILCNIVALFIQTLCMFRFDGAILIIIEATVCVAVIAINRRIINETLGVIRLILRRR